MRAKRLIKLVEQEAGHWSKFGTKYARLEPSTDDTLKKYAPGEKKFDVQIYDDEGATKKYGRFMWDQSPPKKGQSHVTMNGYKWSLKWLPDLMELYNGPSWNASQPGFGPGAMTQTIPEQEGRYIATKQGMMKGYWKVIDTKTGFTVQSGIRTKSVADGIADKWNKCYYKSIKDVAGAYESKVEEEKTPMICRECGHRFKKTIGPGTVEVKCPKCGGYDTDIE